MNVIDTNDNVSAHLTDLKNRRVVAIGRYYSSSAAKRLTRPEATKITQAGMQIFVVFEDSGDPDLSAENGVHHAQIAAGQARVVEQPVNTAIYFALEHLPGGYKKKDLKNIKDYVSGIREGLAGRYKVGIYSDGVVCQFLLSSNLCEYTWLSASSSFEGSKEFYASKKWSLAQDSHIDQDWNGLSVDVNEAQGDFGAFQVTLDEMAVSEAEALGAPPRDLANVAVIAGAGSFATRAQGIAEGEWNFFGRQTYDIDGHVDHVGHSEGEAGFYQRVGEYWLEGTNTHGIDGRNHSAPWSAAFISWVMKKAGAGTQFRYSTQHSVYIFQAIRDFLQKRMEAGYWGQRLSAVKPEVGDIVCWARESGVDYDHQKDGNYAGHCDIVVATEAERIWIIGGNVGNSVTRRPLRLDQTGFVQPVVQHGESLFAIMKNRIT